MVFLGTISMLTHIAFLGPPGSYSHMAAKLYGIRFLNNAIECSCNTFLEIIDLVKRGKVDFGILPLFNTSSGLIHEVDSALKESKLFLIDHISLVINHCLLVACGNYRLDEIKFIYSHPQPFLQCSNFITAFPNWKKQYCRSTAEAMKIVAQLNDPAVAALGSHQGGALYGLQILTTNCANQKYNITKFVVVATRFSRALKTKNDDLGGNH